MTLYLTILSCEKLRYHQCLFICLFVYISTFLQIASNGSDTLSFKQRGDMDDIDLKQGIDRTRHAAEDCLTDDELEMAVNILVKLKYLSLELPPQSYRTARQRIEFLNQSLET